MKHINIVIIAGEEVDICEMTENERKELVDEWNRRALRRIGYEEVKTA